MDRSQDNSAESGMERPGDSNVKSPTSRRSIIVAANDQLSCNLEGEAVILNLKNGVYYGLDPVGARIWDLIQTPMTPDEIRDVLVNEFDVEPDRCEHDILLLLQQLADEGLIAVKDETTA
jgi:Coenzyme PQQ synthesis protein D (PqqD)